MMIQIVMFRKQSQETMCGRIINQLVEPLVILLTLL